MAKKLKFTVQPDDLGYSLVSSVKTVCSIGPCRNLSTLEEAATRAFAGQPDKIKKAKEAIDKYRNKL